MVNYFIELKQRDSNGLPRYYSINADRMIEVNGTLIFIDDLEGVLTRLMTSKVEEVTQIRTVYPTR